LDRLLQTDADQSEGVNARGEDPEISIQGESCPADPRRFGNLAGRGRRRNHELAIGRRNLRSLTFPTKCDRGWLVSKNESQVSMLVGSTALTRVYSKNWPVRALGVPYSGRNHHAISHCVGNNRCGHTNIDAGWKKWLIAQFPPFQLGAMIALKSADLPECTQDLRIVPSWKYGCGRTTSMPVGKLVDCGGVIDPV
jgi:hypothetical protein